MLPGTEAASVPSSEARLTGLLRDLETLLIELPRDALPDFFGGLERLRWVAYNLKARDSSPQYENPKASSDRLLTSEEAAKKLSVSADYLYRQARRLPFTVRIGKLVRFSEAGLDAWIRKRAGKV